MITRLKRRKRERSGIAHYDRRDWPRHRQHVRGFACVISNCECNGDIEAAHVRTGTGGGAQLKPHDAWCIPLCQTHHGEQHQIGERQFEKKYGIDMRVFAKRLAQGSPVDEVRERARRMI